MKVIPLLGTGVVSGFPSITAQDRVNCYIERQKDGEKTNVVAYGTPGLQLFYSFGSTPIRGMLSVGDYLYCVHRDTLYQVRNDLTATTGTPTVLGTLSTASGRVSMAYNGTHIIVVDGTTDGKLYEVSTGVFSSITADGFVACDTVCFLNGYFIVNRIDTGQFYISGLYDATSWDALDYATAESNPDNIVAVFADHGELLLFGEFTTEAWGNNGAQDFPFQRIGTPVEWGLAAKRSIAKLDNAVAFLARNRMGQVQVVLMTGYTPQRISTNDIERIINDEPSVGSASAYSYMVNGHPMYVLNVGDYSLLYDLSSNCWSHLKSGQLSRHFAEFGENFLGITVVADYDDGQLYRLLDTVFDDAGIPSVLSITCKHIHNNREFLRIFAIEVDMQHGQALSVGQGSNPQIGITISKDGGNSWGATRFADIGPVGEYTTRSRVNRLGQARDFVVKIEISDPIQRAIIGLYAEVA